MVDEKWKIEENWTDMFDDLLDDSGWVESIKNLKIKKQLLSAQTKILWILDAFLLVILIVVIWIYNFLVFVNKPYDQLTPFQTEYTDNIKLLIKKFKTIFSKSQISNMNDIKWVDFSKKSYTQVENLKKYVNSNDIMFYDKFEFKNKFENSFFDIIPKLNSDLSKYQKLLVKYKFFPNELQAIVKDIKILPILTTLNSIKLYVIDYVYIKWWFFNDKIFNYVYTRNSFLNKYWTIDKKMLFKVIINDLKYFKDQWAYIYLKTIYFNYMYDPSDNLAKSYFVDTFKKVFSDHLKRTFLVFKKYIPNLDDSEFEKDYILFISKIYERTLSLQQQSESDILPVDVQLISYNPNTEQLSFLIKIMIPSDISWKTSPVSLFSDIVTLLRKSRLIIWKTIKYNNIKVKEITKRVWWYKFTFLSANQKFTTSVQPKVEVEVSDDNY